MSKNYQDHIERELSRVERERQQPVAEDEIASLIADFESPDPEVRAAALRRSCPCHVSWDVYERLREFALRLRKDPAPEVRAVALHLEEDALMLKTFEDDARGRTEA